MRFAIIMLSAVSIGSVGTLEAAAEQTSPQSPGYNVAAEAEARQTYDDFVAEYERLEMAEQNRVAKLLHMTICRMGARVPSKLELLVEAAKQDGGGGVIGNAARQERLKLVIEYEPLPLLVMHHLRMHHRQRLELVALCTRLKR